MTDFETFWAAIIARIEARSGEDLNAHGHRFCIPLPVVKEMMRETFKYARGTRDED
jgi:hypothetical protein